MDTHTQHLFRVGCIHILCSTRVLYVHMLITDYVITPCHSYKSERTWKIIRFETQPESQGDERCHTQGW